MPLPSTRRLLAALAAVLLASAPPAFGDPPPWETLAPGLAWASLPMPGARTESDSLVSVLRIDPHRWRFVVRSAAAGEGTNHSTRGWARREGLTAAINAGMYDVDRSTHVGLLLAPGHRNNPRHHPSYQACFAADPRRPGLPPAATFDLDRTPLDTVTARYHTVVQNLRLVKRPGENRWKHPGRVWWSAAALGEDREGRILWFYTPAPIRPRDWADMLLDLPLGLETLQHLEGSLQAQMHVQTGGRRIEYHTGRRVHGKDEAEPVEGAPIPNILGIRPR